METAVVQLRDGTNRVTSQTGTFGGPLTIRGGAEDGHGPTVRLRQHRRQYDNRPVARLGHGAVPEHRRPGTPQGHRRQSGRHRRPDGQLGRHRPRNGPDRRRKRLVPCSTGQTSPGNVSVAGTTDDLFVQVQGASAIGGQASFAARGALNVTAEGGSTVFGRMILSGGQRERLGRLRQRPDRRGSPGQAGPRHEHPGRHRPDRRRPTPLRRRGRRRHRQPPGAARRPDACNSTRRTARTSSRSGRSRPSRT